MLKVTPNPTFTARVGITVAGEEKPRFVSITFRHMGKKALAAFFESVPGRSDEELISSIVTAWDGFDAPFSAETMASVLDAYPAAAEEIYSAWRRELLESRVKNSV